jgi:hypothetical protein
MRLCPLNVATATVFAFAFPQAPHVLAQSYDDGAMGQRVQLDGGPAAGSDNPGQAGSSSESSEPPAGTKSKEKPSKPLRNRRNSKPPFGGYVEHFGWQPRYHAGILFQRHLRTKGPRRSSWTG